MRKQGDNDLQRKLRSYVKQYREVKQRIHKVGFICAGSLVERRMTCGNPKCLCSRDPEKLHGPYYQLSWKEKGKSVSRFLSSEEAVLYREWIDNRGKLTAIIEKMYDISQQVRGFMLPAKAAGKRQPARGKKVSRPGKPRQNTGQTPGYHVHILITGGFPRFFSTHFPLSAFRIETYPSS